MQHLWFILIALCQNRKENIHTAIIYIDINKEVKYMSTSYSDHISSHSYRLVIQVVVAVMHVLKSYACLWKLNDGVGGRQHLLEPWCH